MFAKNVALVSLSDNVCKVILQKVLKLRHTRSFGLEDVIETIEDLVLTEQRYLGQSQFEDKEYKGFQCDDHLYIYPAPGGGVSNQCAHVTFEDKSGAQLKGSLELPGIGSIHPSVTWFLQYDVDSQQEVHQWIFMEHIPYMFREIFVSDLESDDLFTAKHEVVSFSQSDVHNINEHFGKEGNEVYLSGVFQHIKGMNFKYHTLLNFETWDCFKNTKADLQKFKESQTSQTGQYEAYLAGWVMFTCKPRKPFLYRDFIPSWLVQYRVRDSDNKRDDGNVTNGSLDNNAGLKPATNNLNESENNGDNASNPSQDKGNKRDEESNLNESQNTAKMKTLGAKSSVVKKLQLASKNWRNELEKSVQSLNYSLDVTVSKLPLTSGEAQRKKKGELLEDDDSESSSDSQKLLVDINSESSFDSEQQVSEYELTTPGTSDNEKDSEFDTDLNSNSDSEGEGEEDNEC
eukprot:jgi/Psemu1/7367/gm1.7367_g